MPKVAIVIFIMLSMLISSCSSTKIEYMTPNDFKEAAKMPYTSVYSTDYIGRVGNRVYIQHANAITLMHMLGLSKQQNYTIYWTEFSELPVDFIDKLEKQKEQQYDKAGNL